MVQVPQKIKQFMWKACSNILPLCTKLFDRKITSNFSCPVCGDEAETIDHTFMNCSVALAVWGKHPNLMALLQSGMCFVDWVEVILSSLSSPDIEIFFTLVWFIWRHCNEVWSGSHPGEVKQISLKASRYALEFLEAVSDPSPSLEVPSSAWTPPSSSHLFKVNVASVLFKERQEVGIGVIVRNSQGVVLAATSEKISSEGDWLWSSAISLLKSLKLLLSIGFFTVEIECNNSYLVSLLNSGKDFFTETGWIIEDIRELLPSFYSISFKSIPKLCNHVALALASFSKEKDEQSVWLEDCPPFLFPIVSADFP